MTRQDPQAWQNAPHLTPILGWWWGTWLASNFVLLGAWRALTSDDVAAEELITANYFSLASDALTMVAAVLAFMLVRRYYCKPRGEAPSAGCRRTLLERGMAPHVDSYRLASERRYLGGHHLDGPRGSGRLPRRDSRVPRPSSRPVHWLRESQGSRLCTTSRPVSITAVNSFRIFRLRPCLIPGSSP